MTTNDQPQTIPAPPLPTLADMTPDEQDECAGMQADLAQGDRVVILDGTPDAAGLVQVLEKSLDVYRAYPAEVTPRPDLPRMEWPGDTEPVPVPALPDGWRLADHPEHGRVLVVRIDGEDAIYATPYKMTGIRTRICMTSDLEFADTSTGPGHLAVGTVIESADDPRLAALPYGSMLIDRDGGPFDITKTDTGEWAGPGYVPMQGTGTKWGPWTVRRIGREADQ